ncbi:MAG: amidohydrolase [Solirubrobacterales bacterium]|nr:amidohydrolase [Solirubrobacterales bacterium]
MTGPADGNLILTNARLDDRTVGLIATEGRIERIGPEVHEELTGNEPAAGSGITRIDAAGAPICPPLINAHTHAAMTLFRGHGDDLPLMRWLREAIWPVEARIEAEDVYWGTRLACLELIRAGTSTFWDMYWHPEASARAVRDAGMRAIIGPPLLRTGPDDRRDGSRQAYVEQFDSLAGSAPGIGAAVAPHSIYTVDREGLEFAAGLAAERDLPIHIHLSETAGEVEDCLAEHGMRPASYLDACGLLGPKTLLAHGVYLDPDELALIAERGATVATNPVANMKLAVGGVFPLPAAREAGVKVALGTDGAASNNSLDPLADLRVLALLQRHHAERADAIPVSEAWAIATGRRSELIGGAIPPLTPGAPADFILLDPAAPELAVGELESNLVYATASGAVRDVVVNGRPVMLDRDLPGSDEVIVRARERASRLGL